MTPELDKAEQTNWVRETFAYYLSEAENGWCKIPRRVADDLDQSYLRLTATLAAKEAECDALRVERYELSGMYHKQGLEAFTLYREWQAAAEAADGKLKRMESALKMLLCVDFDRFTEHDECLLDSVLADVRALASEDSAE